MISFFQAIVLGALQGATELFPVSSLGHGIILPALFGWHIDENTSFFLVFLVATHLATSLVLLCFYWNDWKQIIAGVIRSLMRRRIDPADKYEKLGWLIILATIPAGILGLLFEKKLTALLAAPLLVSCALAGNGILLYGAEVLRKKQSAKESFSDEDISELTWTQSVKIGFAQALALIPGFSRTGAALGGGLLSGLDHEDAARFSFLLATPIILGAAALKIPKLFTSGMHASLGPVIAGTIASGIFAFFSVRFLDKWFRTKSLSPFALYCIVAGLISAILFAMR